MTDNDGAKATTASANKKDNGKSATKIDWEPDPAGGMITVWVETRGHSKNGKYRPTSCGALWLNDGAQAFEIDPATWEPKLDEFGDRLPPILESNQLCLAAVSDVDLSGSIDPDGGGDEDGDGLTDLEEACVIGTDPCLGDTDDDGVLDGVDQCPLDGDEGNVDANGCPNVSCRLTQFFGSSPDPLHWEMLIGPTTNAVSGEVYGRSILQEDAWPVAGTYDGTNLDITGTNPNGSPTACASPNQAEQLYDAGTCDGAGVCTGTYTRICALGNNSSALNASFDDGACTLF